jgi:hypothetical protein
MTEGEGVGGGRRAERGRSRAEATTCNLLEEEGWRVEG